MKDKKKLSICIATYNGERFITEQLQSILTQISIHDEIVIYDDFSSDKTVEKIRSLGDPRINLITANHNRGYSCAFESSLKAAKGEYIFLSDQDDVWFSKKVDTIMSELEKSDFVVHDACYVDDGLRPLGYTGSDLRPLSVGFFANLFRLRPLGCAMAFHRRILAVALPLPKNRHLMTHDAWLMFVASVFFSSSLVSDPLIYYRRHDSNASSGGMVKNADVFKKVSIRGYAVFHIIRRYLLVQFSFLLEALKR